MNRCHPSTSSLRPRSLSRVALLLLPLLGATPGWARERDTKVQDTPNVSSKTPRRPVTMKVVPVTEDAGARNKPTEADIASLRAAVTSTPKLRKPRAALVHALVRAGRIDEAYTEALAWREHDAYSLLAVRQLGDIETARGDVARARRTYSAIVELLPKDVEARRALATILKQNGDLAGARSQLQAALALQETDRRTAFELADVEQRLGLMPESRARFEATVAAPDVSEALRYPAKQRLAQIYAQERRAALLVHEDAKAAERLSAIEGLHVAGGTENDIKVFLTWDTDRTDIDLWVKTPSGEQVDYKHRKGKDGEALFDDVTSGYGPESFTAQHAQVGTYVIAVNFFGGRGAIKEARGEVSVVIDEGRPTEKRAVFPYRIFDEKDTVVVAKVQVGGAS